MQKAQLIAGLFVSNRFLELANRVTECTVFAYSIWCLSLMKQLKLAPFPVSPRQPMPSAACSFEALLLEAMRDLSLDDQHRIYQLVRSLARSSGPITRSVEH